MIENFKITDYNDVMDFSDIKLTPLKAIKLKCKECCGYNSREAKKCNIKTCPLNQFITKRNKYNISEEERNRRKNIFN